MSQSAQLQKKEEIERARKKVQPKIEEPKKYDMTRCRTCGDIESLKASGVMKGEGEFEWPHRQQRFGNGKKNEDEYLQQF